MEMPRDVAAHYGRGDLLERLNAALREDGADPGRPTLEALAPYDQFHGRGIEATREVADAMPARSTDHLLDVGSGIGGPARYFAHRFGCRVTGIDLTAEFCALARHLARATGLESRVAFEQGDALAMPFAPATFDGACSMNVSMNIADKGALYREIGRVVKPGGWLVLSELAQGPGGEVTYPTPWAATAGESFLATPEQTRRGLEDAGFTVVRLHDTVAQSREFAARSRAIVEGGGKPPHRALFLVHPGAAREILANVGRAFAEARVVPIEVFARRRG